MTRAQLQEIERALELCCNTLTREASTARGLALSIIRSALATPASPSDDAIGRAAKVLLASTNGIDAEDAYETARNMLEAASDWEAGAEAMRERLKFSLDTRLNNSLCQMKEGYDDSIHGFNEAWDIVRECVADIPLPRRPA